MKHDFLDQFDPFTTQNGVFGGGWQWSPGLSSQDPTFHVAGTHIEGTYFPTGAGSTSAGTITASMSGSTYSVTAGGITINLVFDTAAMAAPQSFRDGIEQAASILAQNITDKITVNLAIDYSGTGGGAAAGPDSGYYENYSWVRSELVNNASPGDTTFNYLPSGTTVQGQSLVAVWNAQLKLWGVLGANDTTTDDGSATFATDIDPSLLVGVALHELTHALGRVPYGSAPDIFDLFRFTSPGVRLFSGSSTAPAAYFSLDGGATKVADFGRFSDPSDFLNSGVQGPNDPFNEYYTSSTSQTLSKVDLQMLDALGFHINTGSTPSATPMPDLTISNLSVTGTTVSFKLNDTGSADAGASVSGLYLSKDATITTSDTLIGTYSLGSLSAGGSQTESVPLSLPSNLAAGTYYLGVLADSTSSVTESSESNNTSSTVKVLVGSAIANSISGSNAIMFGMAGNDTLVSNGGNNIMIGGAGSDTLRGGSGNDQFVFNTTSEGLDQIFNFHSGDHIDFALTGFGSGLALSGANTGVLDPSNFIASSTAPTTGQEFWFNTSTHTLYFDSNGAASGGLIAIAHLNNSYVLHNTDILIV